MAGVKSLQAICISSIVSKIKSNEGTIQDVIDLRCLPPGKRMDVYLEMLQEHGLNDMLSRELADLNNFKRLLYFTPIRQKLFLCVISLVNRGTQLAVELRHRFITRFMQKPYVVEVMNNQTREYLDYILDEIQFGLRLGSFLSEAGWLMDGLDIFTCIILFLNRMPTKTVTTVYLDCLRRILHSEICLNNFNEAKSTYNILVQLLDSDNLPKNLVISCYIQLGEMHLALNEYMLCHMYSLLALEMLEDSTPERIAIDAMRQAAKACVAVGHLHRAHVLILHAISRAKRIFGDKHQKYADALMDYGYVLLKVDALRQSVAAYKEALDIKRCIFGIQSFYVAIAYVELSYASYKQNNSEGGDFFSAYYHIEIALDMFRDFVPEDHLKMVSIKQIKALLLDKLALQNSNMNVHEGGLLKLSEDLYKDVLQQSLEGFGEKNLRIAELYDNLGSLYIRKAQYKMLQEHGLNDMLSRELADLNNFKRLLYFTPIRQKLFLCVISLVNRGTQLAVELRHRFITRFMQEPYVVEVMNNQTREYLDYILDEIQFGLRLGSFLSEAGWLMDGLDIFTCIILFLNRMPTKTVTTVYLDCLRRILHSEICLNNFNEAKSTYNILVQLLDSDNLPKNLVISCYIQLGEMHLALNEYMLCHMYSLLALEMLEDSTPERIAIDAMRQAAKACVAVGHLHRAHVLILHAISRAKRIFGDKHQKYADALMDYGYVLLKVDALRQSVAAYKEALDIKRCIFGIQSFYVAIAYVELSYASYKQNNSEGGDFFSAYYHIEIALDMFRDFLPEDHLKMVSIKQIKALLLDKLALQNSNMNVHEGGLLKLSEDLYKGVLQQSLEGFGEKNLRIAELYDNLGTFYIRKAQYKKAERMFKKAIEIKSECMFPYDYGVETANARLASLYCYKMKKYREAEKLYLRSIEITLKLFGDVYFGLEDYYIGLCYIYTKLGEDEKYFEYTNMLHTLRQYLAMQNEIIPAINENCSLKEIKEEFKKTPHPQVNYIPRPKLF